MSAEPIPIIVRDFPAHASAEAQVQEFYDRWSLFNETKQAFEQIERNQHFAAKTGTGVLGDPKLTKVHQQERAAAIPVLKLAVVEALEIVERLPEKALRTLSQDDRIKLRWALLSLRQDRSHEDELTQLQEHYQTQERDHDRDR